MDQENSSSSAAQEPTEDPTRRLVPLRERPWWREHAGLLSVLVFTALILIELAIAVANATDDASSAQAASAPSSSTSDPPAPSPAPVVPVPIPSSRSAAPAAPSSQAAQSAPSAPPTPSGSATPRPSSAAPAPRSAPVAPAPTPTVPPTAHSTAPSVAAPSSKSPATTPRSSSGQAKSGQAGSSRIYQVRRGDTLASIALRHGVGYQRIAADNAIADPDVITPGQRLRIAAPVPNERVIAPGDTLSGLASATGQSVERLLALNPGITDPDRIPAGGVLRVRT